LVISYNRERYIGAAIENVLASTLTDFELIVLDDRSADGTVEIARAAELKRPWGALPIKHGSRFDEPHLPNGLVSARRMLASLSHPTSSVSAL
jgi:glycosyltransferase involved in cell wall biosynthesis